MTSPVRSSRWPTESSTPRRRHGQRPASRQTRSSCWATCCAGWRRADRVHRHADRPRADHGNRPATGRGNRFLVIVVRGCRAAAVAAVTRPQGCPRCRPPPGFRQAVAPGPRDGAPPMLGLAPRRELSARSCVRRHSDRLGWGDCSGRERPSLTEIKAAAAVADQPRVPRGRIWTGGWPRLSTGGPATTSGRGVAPPMARNRDEWCARRCALVPVTAVMVPKWLVEAVRGSAGYPPEEGALCQASCWSRLSRSVT